MARGIPQPTTQPTVSADNKSKNEKLAYMLYALGGALRGDKNFVQNTLALQKMEEGKKKKEAQKKTYQEFLKKIDPESPFYDLAKAMGAEALPQLLLEQYKAQIPKQLDPQKLIKAEELKVLQKLKEVGGDITKLSGYEKQVYENYIGKKPGIAEQLLSGMLTGETSVSGGGDEPLIIKQINP